MASPWGRLEKDATGEKVTPPELREGKGGHWVFSVSD